MNYTGKTFKEATKKDLIAIAEAGTGEVEIATDCEILLKQGLTELHHENVRVEFYEYGEIHSDLETLNTFAAVDKARELGYYLPSNTGSSSD
jgi:hypothetical protein